VPRRSADRGGSLRDYARVAALLHPAQAHPPGVHPRAVVAADATIAPGASIGACVVIESGARVGEHARVGPGCVVGARAEIGSSSELVASVVVCHDVRIGSRVSCIPAP
jgi:UDP-3-O-[3-hydroxymyristoyl] glucosamine N-acyltransferase